MWSSYLVLIILFSRNSKGRACSGAGEKTASKKQRRNICGAGVFCCCCCCCYCCLYSRPSNRYINICGAGVFSCCCCCCCIFSRPSNRHINISGAGVSCCCCCRCGLFSLALSQKKCLPLGFLDFAHAGLRKPGTWVLILYTSPFLLYIDTNIWKITKQNKRAAAVRSRIPSKPIFAGCVRCSDRPHYGFYMASCRIYVPYVRKTKKTEDAELIYLRTTPIPFSETVFLAQGASFTRSPRKNLALRQKTEVYPDDQRGAGP